MRERLEGLFLFLIDYGPTLATIAFATYVISIAQAQPIPTETLLQWILAILGLLSISQLVERLRSIRKIENSTAQTLKLVGSSFVSRQSADAFFMKRLPPLSRFETATDINLFGVALQRTIRDNIHVLAEVVRRGGHYAL